MNSDEQNQKIIDERADLEKEEKSEKSDENQNEEKKLKSIII